MSHRIRRREFVQGVSLATAGFWLAGSDAPAQDSKSPNERIKFACIGVGGKGDGDSRDAANSGDIVAICDIDDQRLSKAGDEWAKGAKRYNDFRKMFDEMGKSIDAFTVSTPDHTHAVSAAAGMKMGKHCFCQKPLTHSIYEARRLGEIAREMKVATQMGNQGTAQDGLRKAAALLKAGICGNVKEVHVWTNRPIWPQGIDRPKPAPETPKNVHWNEFLGPAPERPYAGGYHPFSWRGWWDFGTGALGDMACHTMNMAFAGLDLREPISVEAQSSGHNKDSYPKWAVVRYEFPARGSRGPLTLYWYEGKDEKGPKLPAASLLMGHKASASGSLIVGDKCSMYSPNDYGASHVLLGSQAPEEPKVDYIKSPGHFQEWVRAIKGGETAMSNFPDYAGPLTETVLLGNLAVWAGKKVEWDAKGMIAKNCPEVATVIRPEYRKGYEL